MGSSTESPFTRNFLCLQEERVRRDWTEEESMLHIAMIVVTALVGLMGPASSTSTQTEAVDVQQRGGRGGPSCSNVGDPGVAYCTVVAELDDGSCVFQCKDGLHH